MKGKKQEDIFRDSEELRQRLRELVYDQHEAIDTLVDGLLHAAWRPLEAGPRAVFTFLGPAASGKVHLARSLAGLLAGYGFTLFDMEQYADPEMATQLLAPANGEAGQEGELVALLRAQSQAVVVFDNIERADNLVQSAVLDLLTKASGTNGLDASRVIAVFTTTVASDLLRSQDFLETWRRDALRGQALLMEAVAGERKAVFDTIQNALAPRLAAMLARGFLVPCAPLSLHALLRVGATALEEAGKHFTETTGIALEFQDLDLLAGLLTLTQAPRVEVGTLRRKLPDLLLSRITRFLRGQAEKPTRITVRLNKPARQFWQGLDQAGDTLQRELFKRNETVELLWKEYRRGSELFFSIDRAERQHQRAAREFLREERPQVEFSSVGFRDIAGNQATKETLQEIIRILREPELVRRFGIDMPRGMLLHGPAGVGKTMLARAFAREANRPAVYVSRTELFDPHFLHLAFDKARQYAPSIVLLDGVDVKGVVEGVLTPIPVDDLIREIDALPAEPQRSVFLVAIAQDQSEVSPLLTGPDRIDILVKVPELDREARKFFIEKILEKPNDGKIDVDKVVRYISGMSGYDLQRIGKEAAISAIRSGRECITEEILIEQINSIKYGTKLEKRHIRNLEEELKHTAYHEAGHAVLSSLLLPDIRIEQVTIAPRLASLGFISYTFEDFPSNFSKEEVFHNICVLLAGRLASIKKFGQGGLDTGAANDLEQATQQAWAAVALLGMDEEIGFMTPAALAQVAGKRFLEDKVEKRLAAWIESAKDRATELLEEHWPRVEKLAAQLILQEVVDGDELASILAFSPETIGNGKETP